MAYVFHAYSNNGPYNTAWKNLNIEEYLGFDVKSVFGKMRFSEEAYSRIIEMRTSRPVSKREMIDCMHQFCISCRCEHDCCGHYNGGPLYHTLKGNKRGTRWIVKVSYYRNI